MERHGGRAFASSDHARQRGCSKTQGVASGGESALGRAVGVDVVQTRTSKQRHIAITRQAAQNSVICVTSVTASSDEAEIHNANECDFEAESVLSDSENDASLQALSYEWAEGGYEEEDDSYLEAIRR